MPNDRWSWDATATLEALGAADVALWLWEPEKDRLHLTGASRALGLGPLAPECSSAAMRALALPPDRALAEDVLRVQEPGTEISVRLRMRGGGFGVSGDGASLFGHAGQCVQSLLLHQNIKCHPGLFGIFDVGKH